MNTNLTQEQISALADGELGDFQTETVLAALRHPDGRAAWEIYHQIGDTLRSDETALTMSPDFSQRLFARLDAEPTIVAPVMTPAAAHETVAVPAVSAAAASFFHKRALKRFAVPGMVAAAAVATVAFITTPQLMVANGGRAPATMQAMSVAAEPGLTNAALEAPVIAVPVAAGASAAAVQEEVMLRDPRIDEYLFAHQRFSSSVSRTAQFARSTTFASDSGK